MLIGRIEPLIKLNFQLLDILGDKNVVKGRVLLQIGERNIEM